MDLSMKPGQVIGGRFELEHLVRQGGGSRVFRAQDAETGRRVALKLLHRETRSRDVERFLRQAETLRSLRHEAIASHVAHGQTPAGQAFLATEWLEGEDLAHRLSRQPMTVGESLALVRRVAQALSGAHGRGVVHGELRPSKLLLHEGRAEQAVLLGYGITSLSLDSHTFSGSGEILATLRYLAPELAQGEEQRGASADIYALGCVLFECLTGRPPLVEPREAEGLTQLLYREVLRLRQVREDLPESLEALLTRMMARQPTARLANGSELAAVLARLELSPEQQAMVPAPLAQGALGESERRLLCAVLVLPRPAGSLTETPGGSDALLAALEPWLAPLGARAEPLAEGAVMVTSPGSRGTATDQAVQAARLALLVRQRLGDGQRDASVVVTTGQGLAPGAQPLGEGLEHAMALLRKVQALESPGPAGRPPVWLDELTAGLLDPRFHVRRVAEGLILERERTGAEERRLLLGRQTPYVGRDIELGTLDNQLGVTIDESVARGVLVIAPPGMGKSRLRQEFLRRAEERAEGVEVLIGRGDPLRAGAAYGLLGQAVRDACGLGEVEEEEQRRRSFAARVERNVEKEEQQRVVEFLGEMCGVPLGEGESPQLRAARQEPRLMNDQVTAAWVKFLRSECRVRPVLLVLEDLHWGDAATVRLVDVTLRELAEERFMVLALARPEIKEVYPRLWAEHPVQELRLSGLGRRACERLVREMLGEGAAAETVDRIVQQADGNALFLEELIRGTAEGTGERHPETVLVMLQARLARLAPEGRRLLEMASLMGETFWKGALGELLGSRGEAETKLDRWLRTLVEAEMIVRQRTSRLAGETQYAFRHALVRDAAYGLLSEEDRRAGHRRVGACLERMGERDLVVLAEHYRLGGEGERAAGYFAEAAAQAVRASDVAGAIACVERGVACGATGEVLGRLRAAEAQAQHWSWNFQRSYEAGKEGQTLLPPGSVDWHHATMSVIVLGPLFEPAAVPEQVRAFAEALLQPGSTNVFADASGMAGLQLLLMGLRDVSSRLLGRMAEICETLEASEVRKRGMLASTTFWFRFLFEGDPWPALQAADESMRLYAAAEDRRYVGAMQGYVGWMRCLLGDEQGLALCRAAVAAVAALGEAALAGALQGQLALVLAEMGGPHREEALALADQVLARYPTPFWGVLASSARAIVLSERGDLAAAEEATRNACAMAALLPTGGLLAAGLRSRALLALGRVGEAHEAADAGLQTLAHLGGAGFMDVRLLLAAAEARRALGQEEAAREALAEAARRIERRAAQIPDGPGRERYRSGVRDHARVLELLGKT
ncbi:MAG TPA: protein kinase [Polyangia bacterium]|nr:protein kinase [Polyangia bacterium]